MLKRLSSLILVLVTGSSVLAVTSRPTAEHFCGMAGMGTMPAIAMMDDAAMDHGMMDHGTMDHGTAHGIAAAGDHGPAMPSMEIMPCCRKHDGRSVSSESGYSVLCCVAVPRETVVRGRSFQLRPPVFSPAILPLNWQSPLPGRRTYDCSLSIQVFLPNLQGTYVRNLALLI